VVSGNYAWLNWITIVILVAAVPNWLFTAVLPLHPAALPAAGPLQQAAVIGLTLLVAVLSYQPARNLLGRRQLMNYSFNPLHIVNTYGAFGSVTRTRDEVVVEGTDEPDPTAETRWLEYEFKGKPGDPRRRPPQVAPYHLRLDWLMWFLPLSPAYGEAWFARFLQALFRNDRAVLGLLRSNPFPDQPPAAVRARLYRYRFTTWSERRQTGAWWVREPRGDLVPPVALRATQLVLGKVVGHVRHDRVGASEEAQLEAQAGLVVQEVLPPVARDDLGEHHQHRPPRVLRLQRVEVAQERADQRAVG
jgi:hypothetical protein